MQQRVSLITLGVADDRRAKAFYEALGWRAQMDVQSTVFFEAGGCVVVLWSREKLAQDTGLEDDGGRFGGVVLAHNVRSREEVHAVLDDVRAAGGRILREPAPTFYGGYAGAFADLDDHAWEVAHNPGFELDEEGRIVLPDAVGG